MRYLLLSILAIGSLPGQFYSLAVTDSGTLYFSTALSIGNEDSRSKIYKITADKIELFATGGETTTAPIFAPAAILPVTSGDGSITTYAINYPCASGSCGLAGLPRTFFQLPGSKYSFVNNLQVSRNSRFLLGAGAAQRLTLVDVPAQEATQFPENFIVAGPQAIGNDGTALLRSPQADLYLAPLGQAPRLIPGVGRLESAIISPNADRIVYERANELFLTDLQGSSHQLLASLPRNAAPYQPSFANDGTLLYLLPGGAMIIPPGSEPRRLSAEAGIQRAIISGDGQLAWLVTGSGRILRVATSDGAITEVVPETPLVSVGSYLVLPGSVVRFFGTGFSARTKVQIDNLTFPISEVTSKGGAAQVPWEFAYYDGRVKPLFIQGDNNPFRQQVDFYPADRPTITFEREPFAPAPVLQAAHQDFRGRITKEDPARPGETIHVFARNMGPVDQPIRTGEKAPISPVARVTTPMACYLIATGTNRVQGIVVPFAGLAGGSIGIYQIDVTIPAEWNEPKTTLQCNFDSVAGRFLGDSEPIEVATAEPQH